jgi:hypothetical protein
VKSQSTTDPRVRRLGAASCDHASSGVHLDAARAVRRALADARRKAIDVAAMGISAELTSSTADADAFARLALGSRVEVDVFRVRGGRVTELLAAGLQPGQLGVVVEHAHAVTKATVIERLGNELPAEPEQSSEQQ